MYLYVNIYIYIYVIDRDQADVCSVDFWKTIRPNRYDFPTSLVPSKKHIFDMHLAVPFPAIVANEGFGWNPRTQKNVMSSWWWLLLGRGPKPGYAYMITVSL